MKIDFKQACADERNINLQNKNRTTFFMALDSKAEGREINFEIIC